MASYKNYQNERKKNMNVKNLAKKPKNHVKKVSKKEEFEEKLIDWVTFYRRNLHRFVEHYLQLELHLYQKLLIYLMNLYPLIVVVACRAAAKSFIIAIFACARCILFPNSKIVIASATKGQASLIVTEKIQKELIPNSPNLAREIKDVRTSSNQTEVIFHNGSTITVCPASDNARGLRATVIIYEEFRMIKKEIIDSVLSPFLIVRPAPYLKKKEYEHLKEEPMEIYISSAWHKSHWMWEHMKMAINMMYKTEDSLLIGFDYAITLKHGIRTKKQLIKEKKKLDNMSFAMEYQNLMVGGAENAYYEFNLLSKQQQIKKAFYPRKHIDFIEKKKNKFDIPKQDGELRVVSVDIAMVKRKGNDNTAISCIRALPVKDSYERQTVYIEAFNGGNTTEQAIRIKQIFTDFNADVICLDTQNAGLGISDELGKVLYDEKRDYEYPAWTCFNDENVAERIKNKQALPVIYSIKANATLNHQIHTFMKNALEKGKIKFLVNSIEAKDYLSKKKEYNNANPEEQANFEMPNLQTDLLINEMINLSYELTGDNKIKLVEPRSGTKDRYISVAYGNYYITEKERDLQKPNKLKLNILQLFGFKAPNIRKI
ncbi:terminase large subunit domain-containing protein [Clostridium botulinum]|uniref:terminase large subunit domain-containing protein n=1 Tax=Clostridium botulinum TaxID=1491 RepID=UPI0007731966|nr:terminase large subunit [Clostridium botulinum]APH20937.1 terminase-like family protein [Clostridium botulinum]APQ71131.1 terminase-like family protein [Clostridium botulinum]MBN3379145.1 terminase [Clostridium botulinum]